MTQLALQEFDMGEIHELSLELIGLFEEDGVDVPTGTVATALTLGRCLTNKPMEIEDEMNFIKSVLEFCHAYFAEGEAN